MSRPSDDDATLPPQRSASDDVTVPPRAADSGDTATLPPDQDAAATRGFTRPVAAALPPAPPGYAIEKELGRGGMGVVYLARQVGLNRRVALKMILSGGHASPQELVRFLAEAEAIAQLKHPNVVQIFEVGAHDDRPFFTLEFCGGGGLDGKLAGNPLPPADAARYAEEVARGVAAAHAAGIVHLDLKPANVLLADDGTPKVTDFGLAKRVGSGSDLTATGAVMGTPSYMAPEQAAGKGKETGPLADVYALGAILYELLTGRPPFKAATPLDTMLQVVTVEPVPPRQLNPAVPRDLETVALKCLQKEPGKRYPSADAVADDLARYRRGEPITAHPAGKLEQAAKWVKRNRKLAGMGLAVLLTMALATAVSLGFGIYAGEQAEVARQTAGQLSAALADKTQAEEQVKKKADALASQLTESKRVLDLARLSEANANLDRGALLVARGKLDQIAPENRCLGWGLLYHRCLGSDLTLGGQFSIDTLAVSPDGTRVVGGGLYNPRVRVWDLATGESVIELKGHTKGVSGVEFSRDGTKILTCSVDKTARVWDAATGRPLAELMGHTAHVVMARFSPDGRTVATGAMEPTSRLWDAATGRSFAVLRGHLLYVTEVAFSPDGTTVVTTGADETVRVWDAATGRRQLELKGYASGLSRVAFSPDGTKVATAASDRPNGDHIVRVWHAATGRVTAEMKGHTGMVTNLTFTPDGSKVIGSTGTTARVWDAATGRSLNVLPGHTAPGVRDVAVSPDARRIATTGWDGAARVWDAATGRLLSTLRGHTHNLVLSPAFTPDGRRVVTAGDNTVKVWDADTGQTAVEWAAHPSPVKAVDISADGRRVVTGSDDGTARVSDAATLRTLIELTDDQPNRHQKANPVTGVAVSPDGRRAIALRKQQSARVWDVDGGRAAAVLTQSEWMAHAAFSPDGRRLAAGVVDCVGVWEVATGQRVWTDDKHSGLVSGVGFSADGRLVVAGSLDNTATVWEVASGRLVMALKKHVQPIQCAALNTDGTRAVTGSEDQTALVWDVSSGEPVAVLKGHTGAVVGVAFSPDGKRVLTAGDSTVRVWDTSTGQALIELKGPGKLTGLGVSADGGRVVVTSEDGQVRQWEVDMADPKPGEPIPERELTRRQWLARPRPDVHAKLAEEYKDDPFASAVQKSLEQTALGKLALEAGDKAKAEDHFRTAERLGPKPASPDPPKK